ncbi:hypothetical protein PSTT_02631 [Puccinia striiformis]|uniref:Uncharacterized protein n=1 Tax=Puccinia striiformis TaxID=27350 RepID=A0A2S4VZA9_9BASI|nr:hypothetical protein PSTT_02631 [Puccinia striiformis]
MQSSVNSVQLSTWDSRYWMEAGDHVVFTRRYPFVSHQGLRSERLIRGDCSDIGGLSSIDKSWLASLPDGSGGSNCRNSRIRVEFWYGNPPRHSQRAAR